MRLLFVQNYYKELARPDLMLAVINGARELRCEFAIAVSGNRFELYARAVLIRAASGAFVFRLPLGAFSGFSSNEFVQIACNCTSDCFSFALAALFHCLAVSCSAKRAKLREEYEAEQKGRREAELVEQMLNKVRQLMRFLISLQQLIWLCSPERDC